MRCPKCHYISFGSADRCRNCGYELVPAVEPAPLDLPIASADPPMGPLSDFVLSERGHAPEAKSAGAESTSPESVGAARSSTAPGRFELPLFGGAGAGDDAPLVMPAIPRTPLSVRRGQPAIARPRPERGLLADNPEPGPRVIAHPWDAGAIETAFLREVPLKAPAPEPPVAASVVARILAGLVDLLVLGTIDGTIVYLTLRILDLPLREVWSVAVVPLGVFLLLLNGGYLAVFTAAGGQTIGKMLTRIRVVSERSGEDLELGNRGPGVTLGDAVLRATAYLVSLLPAGLGFAVILFDSDGRALHDRLAETRVVKA
jgi:uncharacterized RDD family membrane protein YckC